MPATQSAAKKKVAAKVVPMKRRALTSATPTLKKPPAPVTENLDSAAVAEAATIPVINLAEEFKAPVVEVAVDEKVTAIIPKAFVLTLDDGTRVPYAAGTDEIPKSHAEHWYSRAHGVTLYVKK